MRNPTNLAVDLPFTIRLSCACTLTLLINQNALQVLTSSQTLHRIPGNTRSMRPAETLQNTSPPHKKRTQTAIESPHTCTLTDLLALSNSHGSLTTIIYHLEISAPSACLHTRPRQLVASLNAVHRASLNAVHRALKSKMQRPQCIYRRMYRGANQPRVQSS